MLLSHLVKQPWSLFPVQVEEVYVLTQGEDSLRAYDQLAEKVFMAEILFSSSPLSMNADFLLFSYAGPGLTSACEFCRV